jgi:hypothetical protein
MYNSVVYCRMGVGLEGMEPDGRKVQSVNYRGHQTACKACDHIYCAYRYTTDLRYCSLAVSLSKTVNEVNDEIHTV